MKKFYFTLLLSTLTFFASAQSQDGKEATSLTARPINTTTSPTSTTNTEVGVTDGALNVSLTGNASYTIPILVPPGINGVEPSISINYNSQAGLSGTAATGWDISGISSITRIPATKFHDQKIDAVDFNGLDRFALDGQRLIVKNGSSATYGADKTEYETEYFSNTKVTSYGVHPSGAQYGPAYFVVEYPNGTKAYYGNSTDSRSVMEWSITNVDNAQGIRISYTYTTASNTLYIDSIKYGGLTSTTPINEVKFVYRQRSIIDDSYVGGVNIKRDKKLITINVISSSVNFRSYFFDYETEDQIKTVTEKNGDNTKSYNPTIFDYVNSSPGSIKYVQANTVLDVGAPILSTNTSTVSGDFDADGNMDFLLYQTSGASAKTKYWLFSNTNPSTPFNTGIVNDIGAFEDIFPVTYLTSTNKISSSQGWAVAKKTGTNYTFTVYNYTYGISSSINTQYSRVVNFPLDLVDETCNATCLVTNEVYKVFPKKIISGDFNGDGLTDIIAIDVLASRKYCKENIANGRCTASIETAFSAKAYFVDLKRDNTTNFLFYAGNIANGLDTNTKVEVGDFNGDGKSDIFIFDLNYVKVYGLSDTNQLVLLYQNSTADTDITLNKPILTGDYNGDGKTDILIPKALGSDIWYKYTSTGASLLKEENSALIFKPNDPYNTFNYFAIDFNNDNKTDIICEKSLRNTANTLGSITVNCFVSYNGAFSASPGISLVTSPDQAEINIYALPVYLPVYQQNLKNGTASSTLQVAFLNQNKIHFFSSPSDRLKDNLLTNVRTGNGVEEAITYIPLSSLYRTTFYNIYTPTPDTGLVSYPYLDILFNPNLYVVSKVERQSKDGYKKRWFGYYGAVSNVEGLGFMGFRSVTQTNWHDDSSKIFTDIYNNDINLRGANIETISAPYLSYPYPEALPPDFTTKSTTTYNIPSDPPLQPNKVFKLKTTNVKESNTLNNTNSEVKDIVYDTNNNITSSTTLSNDGSTLAQTVKTIITYENPKYTPTNPFYILGRPATKIQSVTADGHTMTTNEKYFYNTQELLSSTEKNAIGTSVITESNDYDSYGNITKNTITPTLPMLPRSTIYEYDTTKRFVSKITDNDKLETLFEYDANGLLKKVTDPYKLSKSYTYDSWFKNLTITDDLLKSVVTNVYTRSTEKTIVTTTVSAPSLDSSVSEDTFDDLGRKIKSGTKDLNGNFSYVSFLYDIYDRNIKVSEPYTGGATASLWNEVKFDDYGRNKQTNLFNGRTTSTSYTPASLKAKFTDGLQSKTTTQNAAGNTIATNEDTGGDIVYNYFANGSLRKTKYNGVEIVMEQDGWGQKTKLTDPSAGTYNYTYNDLGELMTETIDGTGITTTITRDDSGKPTKKTIVSPTTDIEINYTYDGYLPLTTTYTDNKEPLASKKTTTTITYDASKRISTIVEEKGTNITKFTTTYTYDAYDRIVTETKKAEIGSKTSTVKTKNSYLNGSLYQILDFDTNKVLWQTNALNTKGQITESQTGNGIKITNTYNPTDGSLSKIQYDKTTAPTANILTLTTVFDKNTDYLSSRINSAFANYGETFKYDDIGRLKEFTNKLGIQETQTYDASGKITGNNLGTYGYDTTKPYQNTSITLNPETAGYYANREGIFNDSMEDKMGWGASKVPNTNFFSYDVTKIPNANAAGKTTLKLANTTTTEQYLYSDKWIAIDNAAPTQYTYSAWAYSDSPQAQVFLVMKDAAGNITTDNIVSNIANTWTPITKTFLVPANIKKISIRLDNNGLGNIWYDDVEIRKTSDPSSVVRKLIVDYNAFKSPLQIEETNVDKISFLYNDNKQRSMMYYGGFQTDKSQRPLRKYYSADGSMEVKENTLTNTFEFITYIGGDGYSAPIIAKSDGINTPIYLYLHRDYQGTILAVTDANGALVEKRLFDAWGTIIKVQDGAGNTLAGLTVLDRGYTGHEHLQSVGLINMNARLYDPILHRFLQVDNYIQDPTSTQNYNQYGYVLNNPLLYSDPSGNTYQDGKDCANCGSSNELSNGQQTLIGGLISTVVTNWDEWGIKDWANKNINGDKFSKWWKKKVSFNNMFGGGGSNKNSAPAPAPNMSSYLNLNVNHSIFEKKTPLLSRFKRSDGRFIIDPKGVPDFSPEGASRITQAVNGLPTAFGLGGRPKITFDELTDVASTVSNNVKINPSKITNNLEYAAVLFHEYRHAWQYSIGNYSKWSSIYGYAAVWNIMERDAYWFQIQMGAGEYFEGYSRYRKNRILTSYVKLPY